MAQRSGEEPAGERAGQRADEAAGGGVDGRQGAEVRVANRQRDPHGIPPSHGQGSPAGGRAVHGVGREGYGRERDGQTDRCGVGDGRLAGRIQVTDGHVLQCYRRGEVGLEDGCLRRFRGRRGGAGGQGGAGRLSRRGRLGKGWKERRSGRADSGRTRRRSE